MIKNYIKCEWLENNQQCQKKAITNGYLAMKLCASHKIESNKLVANVEKWQQNNPKAYEEQVEQAFLNEIKKSQERIKENGKTN